MVARVPGSSGAEQRPSKPRVVGSNPTRLTMHSRDTNPLQKPYKERFV
jgi:hypothetical protein